MESQKKQTKIRKRFYFIDLLLLAIGSTVGAGVFILLPIGIATAGLGIIISLLFASFVTIIVAFNYGELAASFPLEGGGYSWVVRAFGKESSSFIVGWLVWLGNMAYAALSALGFSIYLGVFFNILNPIPIALLSLLVLMVINMVRMKTSIKIENIFTFGILFIFLILWIHLWNTSPLTNIHFSFFEMQFTPIFATASLLYVLFIGFESVSTVSAEAKKSTDLPKAFLLCVSIVTFVYIITSLMIIGTVSSGNVGQTLLLSVSETIRPLLVLGAVFATLTSMNAALIAASRNLYALSRDGMVPKILGRIDKDFKTPIMSLLITGLISSLFILSNAIEYVASLADFGYMVCISMVCASVIVLRVTEPRTKRLYKVPLYPYTSVFGAILPVLMILFLEEKAINTGLLWIFIGFFIYNFYKIIKIETRKEKTKYKFLKDFL
jgi:amino acid transporter